MNREVDSSGNQFKRSTDRRGRHLSTDSRRLTFARGFWTKVASWVSLAALVSGVFAVAVSTGTASALTTTTTLVTDNGPSPSTFGQSVSFTVSVTGSDPTGTVTLQYQPAAGGARTSLTGTLTGGSSTNTATITTTALPIGTSVFYAIYNGDTNNATSNTFSGIPAPPEQTVNGTGTTASNVTTSGCTLFTVPARLVSGEIQVIAIGAKGGAGNDSGGGGGANGDGVTSTLSGLTAGQVLNVCANVGGGPEGSASNGGGAGGGGSSVAINSSGTALVVAGGGGGQGGFFGGGGGQPGANGGSAAFPGGTMATGITPGGPNGGDGGTGTAFSGGQPGTGGPGGNGTNGASPDTDSGAGGGGGGGYAGGGGGGGGAVSPSGSSGGGGGGGGSDYCPGSVISGITVTSCSTTAGEGTQTTAGSGTGFAQVDITYAISPLLTPTVNTTVDDATHNNTWGTQSEQTGATAYDTSTVTGTGPTPTGTVTYTFYATNTCAAVSLVQTSTETISGGIVPHSATTVPLGAFNYGFLAVYNGDTNYAATTGACEQFSVGMLTPTVNTVVDDATHNNAWGSQPEVTGATAYDTSTVTGATGVAPTGTVTYTFFATNNCAAGSLVQTSTETISGGTVPNSATTVPLGAFNYGFKAVYSGDTNYAGATGPCETFSVAKGTPAVATVVDDTATPGVAWAGTEVAGASATDTASVTGAAGLSSPPGGTLTYTLFAGGTCTGSVLSTSPAETLSGGIVPNSPASGMLPAGSYSYEAAYSGDSNYLATNSLCEPFTVLKATPTIATTASSTVVIGSSVSDGATLTNGYNPTGIVTFDLYGPSATPDCSTTPVVSLTGNVTNAAAVSGNFVPTVAGTYYWIASYAGDGNNNAVADTCGATTETVVVQKATPTLTTSATATAVAGANITDTATLTGGFTPTGTVSFELWGPQPTSACTVTTDAAMAFNMPLSLSAPYQASTGPIAAPGPGTYYWVAAYSGDASNNSVGDVCGVAAEEVVVSKATPTLVTTASSTVVVGNAISDSAALASPDPVGPGVLTFTAYNNATCTNPPASISPPILVSGNGTYSAVSFTPTGAGTYYWTASYGGDANNNAVSEGCGGAGESVVVQKASPTVVTTASVGVTVGGGIFDDADLAGGDGPFGSVTFNAYNNATCTGTAAFISIVSVSGNAIYPSGTFATTAAGTYSWTASYNGDSNNNPVNEPCGSAGESVVVAKANPTISTTASPGIVVGNQLTDTATLTSGYNPGGTVTFDLYPTAGCGVPVFASTVNVSGAAATSAAYTTTTPGTYYWTATYSGDANNNAITEVCGGTNESAVVVKASPSISTVASNTVVIGSAVSDGATLANGYNPTGTITFNLYGPNPTNCTGTPVFSDSENVSNAGAASGNFTPLTAGTYYWLASYSGDPNNNAITAVCGATTETVIVQKASPTISTSATATAVVGTNIFDTATLANGYNPTGTVAFALYGPQGATPNCTTNFVATVPAAPLSGTATGGTATTGAVPAPSPPGTYYWEALYFGDANNNLAADTCGLATETVVVTKASPTIATSASSTVVVGNGISDTATLTGAYSPGSTATNVTFKLYGPSPAPSCTTAVATLTGTVNASGVASSGSFTPTAAGTYYWVASYPGDTNNNAVAGTCGASNESVVVQKASPFITTAATGNAVVGTNVTDTATVSNGYNPTGSVTFILYGPQSGPFPVCDGPDAVDVLIGQPLSATSPYTASTGPVAAPSPPGTYYWMAFYSGDTNNNIAFDTCGLATEKLVVIKASPTIATTSSGTVVVGNAINDTATLTGAYLPASTGTNVSFALYGPEAAAGPAVCTGTPVTTLTAPLNASGVATSPNYTPTTAGTYYWVATYPGDVNNNPTAGVCGATNESVVIQKASPALATQASPQTAVVGTTISDTAALAGGYFPTGTVSFVLFGPQPAGPPVCNGTDIAAASLNQPLTASSPYTATSGPIAAPSPPGLYYWGANYNGDVNNNQAGEACGVAAESVTVIKASPTISTQSSGTVVIGNAISDTATLSGAYLPGSTATSIIFTLYGPSASAICTSSPVATLAGLVNAAGVATSGNFTPTTAGTYYWVASYPGDLNNNAVTGPCGATNESVVIQKASPTITTTASANVPWGTAISDSATLANGYFPTGTITFNLYGPSSTPVCTAGYLVKTLTATVTANGTYPSGTYTTEFPGTYYWIASYGGNVNNNTATGNCGDPGESVVVVGLTPNGTALTGAAVCQAYSQVFTTGVPGYTYTATPLPPGLTFNGTTGTLSGTPTAAGEYTIKISATAPGGIPTSKIYTMVIALCINGGHTPLPSGTHGQAYSNTLVTTGGTAPYRYEIEGGQLPPGLTLSQAGLISGTPTSAGTYSVTIFVADSANPGNTGEQVLTITIN